MAKQIVGGVIGLVVGVGLLFWLLAEPHQIEQFKNRFSSSDQVKCFEWHRDRLKDPATAYPVSSFKSRVAAEIDPALENGEPVLVVVAKAKNGFGAYDDIHLPCPLSNGQYSDSAMLEYELKQIKQQ